MTLRVTQAVEYSSNTARGGKQVRTIFRSPWFGRGLRLAVIIGLVAAAWHAWGVWKRFSDDSQTSIKRELTYECAARLPKDADSGREAKVAAELFWSWKPTDVTNRCQYCGSNHRTPAGYRHQSESAGIVERLSGELLVEIGELC